MISFFSSPLSIVETKYSTLLINELIVISFVPASVGRCATVDSDWVELVVSVAQYTHSLAVLAAAPFLLVVPLTGTIFGLFYSWFIELSLLFSSSFFYLCMWRSFVKFFLVINFTIFLLVVFSLFYL